MKKFEPSHAEISSARQLQYLLRPKEILRKLSLTILMFAAIFTTKSTAQTVFTYATQVNTLRQAIIPFVPIVTHGAIPLPQVKFVATTGALSTPRGIAVDAAGDVYVANNGANTITISVLSMSGYSAPTPITIVGTPYTFKNPTALAFDAGFNNLYIADNGNGWVVKYNIGTQMITTVTHAYTPYGVAVDGSGNLYVSDIAAGIVDELAGGMTTHIAMGLSMPSGIAVDGPGNVYVADRGNNQVKEFHLNSVTGKYITTILGTNFSSPIDVTFDILGNLYVADLNNNQVERLTPTSSGGSSGIPYATQFTAFFSHLPAGLVVDVSGDVFVADDFANAVSENTVSCTITPRLVYGLNFDPYSGIISGIPTATSPTSYTISCVGCTSATLNLSIIPATAPTISYSTPVTYNVGTPIMPLAPMISGNSSIGTFSVTPPLPIGLSINSATGIISGTPLVDTGGPHYTVSANLAGGGAAPTVNITVGALAAPGITYSASSATDTLGKVSVPILPTNSSGAGAVTGQISKLGGGFTGVAAVTRDAATGNLYLVNNGSNHIVKLTLSGSTFAPSVISTLTGLAVPASTFTGIAFESSSSTSDIYTVDSYQKEVFKTHIVGTTITTAVFATGFASPYGIAIDNLHNVYITDKGASKMFVYSTTTGLLETTIPTGLSSPCGIIFDGSSNKLYIADYGSSTILKTPTYSAGISLSTAVAPTGISNPIGVIIDGLGDFYISDSGDPSVKYLENGSTSVSSLAPLNSSLSIVSVPGGLAIDGLQNLFIADAGNNTIYEWNNPGGYYISSGTLPTGLTLNWFNGIISGQPTGSAGVSPFTVQAFNAMGVTSASITINTVP